jgi:dolichol kinase
MENKHGFNFLRKVWHILGLIIPISLYLDVFAGFSDYLHSTRAIIVSYLGFFLFLLLVVEAIRLNSTGFENFFYKYFGFLMKESERKRFNGTVPYFLANFLVVLFFSPEIAVLSILFLVIGDPTAAYVGSKYGRNRFYNGKSREGILGFSIAAFLIGIIILYLITVSRPESHFSLKTGSSFQFYPIFIVAFGVIASCLTEFFSSTTASGLIDDNLLIPIVGAITLSICLAVFTGIPLDQIVFNPKDLYLTK